MALPLPVAPPTSLFAANTPSRFWRLLSPADPGDALWAAAVQEAASVLPATTREAHSDISRLLSLTLGEGQFGPEHWDLSPLKRLYYNLKPVLPRPVSELGRRLYHRVGTDKARLGWPVEDRFVRFMFEVMRRLLAAMGRTSVDCIHFWPHRARFALVLTHDVETATGQDFVRRVAELEESHGFRSSFNFVTERYRLDRNLIAELRQRGFEIGIHGLKHDGKLFSSRREFDRRAARINYWFKELDAVGFRSPLTHRQPEWLQALNMEYDLSFFDTDPYEPIAGGTMSVWPFVIGRFIELPYTLVQDHTLRFVLAQSTPSLWFQKLDFIASSGGMVLLNSHPDYLQDPTLWRIYVDFLQGLRGRSGAWHALPRDVARWWRARARAESTEDLPGAVRVTVPGPLISLDPA